MKSGETLCELDEKYSEIADREDLSYAYAAMLDDIFYLHKNITQQEQTIKKLTEALESIANKKWLGEVHTYATKTLQEIKESND